MAALASKSSARLIRPAKSSIDFLQHTQIVRRGSHRAPCGRRWYVHSAVQPDFYLNGCWQAQARQAEGTKPGSGGQVTHRAAAVHRLVLCAGDLSTAGASAASSPRQVWRNPISKLPETTHRLRRRAEVSQCALVSRSCWCVTAVFLPKQQAPSHRHP